MNANDDIQDIPIINVTAPALDGDEERVLEVGCNTYISKPYSAARIIDLVNNFLG